MRVNRLAVIAAILSLGLVSVALAQSGNVNSTTGGNGNGGIGVNSTTGGVNNGSGGGTSSVPTNGQQSGNSGSQQ